MTKLKWLGPRLPKTVELPVPFTSLSAKTGEVICNPTGEFPDEAASWLLEQGSSLWERVTDLPIQAPLTTMNQPPKRLSGFALINERRRAAKAAKNSEPSQPPAEGSHVPSPAQPEGAMEVV